MKLSAHEVDKLSLSNTGFLAQKRLASGLRLNIPESIALLVFQVLELARSGKYSVAQLMSLGRTMLGQRQVIPGVASILDEVQIEATFPDGTKLVTLHDPIACTNGDLDLCLKGSFLPVPNLEVFSASHPENGLIPGAIHPLDGHIVLNAGRNSVLLKVINCSDRPIQVGSHYHFIETNPMLCFDRRASYGKRLNMYVHDNYNYNLYNDLLFPNNLINNIIIFECIHISLLSQCCRDSCSFRAGRSQNSEFSRNRGTKSHLRR